MESAQPKRRYIGGFDGLRTIGVIGVILYHLRPDLFQGGYLGVLLFFVISGYLITDGFVRQYDREGGKLKLGQFFGKRIRRLYPALVTVLLGASAYIGLFARDLLVNLHKIVISNLALVYNWWQIANGQSYFERFAHNESPFVHLWTLSIEGQYYIIWPFIFLLLMKLLKTNGKRFAATMGLALASGLWMLVLYRMTMLGGGDPSRLYYGTDTRIFALLMGSALAFVWPSQKLAPDLPLPSRVLLDGVGTVAAVAMVASLLNLSDQSSALYEGGMVGFSLLAMALVAVIASPATLWGKLLSNPVFHWIGTRSYGIYIYQFPVMIFFENAFRNVADHPVLYPVIEVAIILVISELSYRFIEQPAAHVTKPQLQAFWQRLRHGGTGGRFCPDWGDAGCDDCSAWRRRGRPGAVCQGGGKRRGSAPESQPGNGGPEKGRAGKDQEGAAGPEKGPVLEQIEQSKQQCRFGLCQQQVRASGQPGL
ncbi:acyltransferase [Lacticaseibacillus camelliae DSM 22697 = JCM 13995]|uniref:Acyltransferase n=1 Tax=Lacticaseibacillus camelliae DSM 22697 = JCM 13995 TaxID=1423730 RepID=A0A0R2ER05_9LACO|nr:acyltransferase [Lacticaseibacillus camelliae DSM 22697 = JCM 13995]